MTRMMKTILQQQAAMQENLLDIRAKVKYTPGMLEGL